MTRKILITGLLCGVALTFGPALVRAQSASQLVSVPPGFTAVLVPDFAAGSAPASADMPSADMVSMAMPDPQAMIQQINAMVAAAQQNAAEMQAQLVAMQNDALNGAQGGMRGGAGQESGVVVTTISDGTHSCTQRVVYPGNGGRPNVQLTSAGNGCAMEGMGGGVSAPAARVLLPNTQQQAPAAPALIQARANAPAPVPVQAAGSAMMVADRN